ncbi:hypothetical protein EYF80_031087 [Liparis tanakae]|uniref:Uncharacterized protein n=1 Tax=Liparis tanakae TaxID=230148 RepID=A0A4Z2H0R7_9TELE|nr:hypothetical protein EYF80_031087 [Liparis tanakae]
MDNRIICVVSFIRPTCLETHTEEARVFCRMMLLQSHLVAKGHEPPAGGANLSSSSRVRSPPMQLSQEEDLVEEDSAPTTTTPTTTTSTSSTAAAAALQSKMCSECYVNQTFVHDNGTVSDHKPSRSSPAPLQAGGVLLDISALQMEQQESEEVPPLPLRLRFRDLLLGDQSFQNDDSKSTCPLSPLSPYISVSLHEANQFLQDVTVDAHIQRMQEHAVPPERTMLHQHHVIGLFLS